MEGYGYEGRESVTRGLDGLYAAFHKNPPRSDLYAYYGNLSRELGMTDDAVDAAFAEMRTYAKFPDNLERTLREAWRKWCEAGGISPTGYGDACPDCGGTGWILAWRSGDKAGTGPIAVPCACGAAREETSGLTGGVREWTAADLVAGGWSLNWPVPDKASGPVNMAAVRASVRAELEAEDRRAGKKTEPAPAPDGVLRFGDASQYPF